MNNSFKGLLFIGDPHLASRMPGFRKDDYMGAILKKLEYALNYAQEHQLLPVILGDLFHWPRDNATRLLTQLIRLFDNRFILSVTGNHDITEQTLQDDDSLSILAAANRIYLLDRKGPWKGMINDVPVIIGGSSWSERIPTSFQGPDQTLVIWVSHHNICFSEEDATGVKPQELSGIHLVINGHIHRSLPQQIHGMTTWINPGNISRVQRCEAIREVIPSVLKLTPLNPLNWITEKVELPHEPFENVFHPISEAFISTNSEEGSAFIRGLEELESMRTSGGAGLVNFINNNIGLFEKEVAEVILNLVKEVCPDEFH
jgi:predicted phosphodiesterase